MCKEKNGRNKTNVTHESRPSQKTLPIRKTNSESRIRNGLSNSFFTAAATTMLKQSVQNYFWFFSAAAMKSRNKGCAWVGRDLNSGWN